MPAYLNVTYAEDELARVIDFCPFQIYKKIFVIKDENLDDIFCSIRPKIF